MTSPQRRTLLAAVQARNATVADLAVVLGLSPQATYHHVQRLHRAGLFAQDAEGRYGLSRLGRLVHEQSLGLTALGRLQEFLLAHRYEALPTPFRLRMHDLAGARSAKGGFANIETALRILREARRSIRILATSPLPSSYPLLAEATRGGIAVDVVLPAAAAADPDFRAAGTAHRFAPEHLRLAVVPAVTFGVLVTEHEAIVGLEDLAGAQAIGNVLVGSDVSFLRFADDLFRHEWDRAKLLRGARA